MCLCHTQSLSLLAGGDLPEKWRKKSECNKENEIKLKHLLHARSLKSLKLKQFPVAFSHNFRMNVLVIILNSVHFESVQRSGKLHITFLTVFYVGCQLKVSRNKRNKAVNSVFLLLLLLTPHIKVYCSPNFCVTYFEN